jgi:hypothetical protein
MKHSRFERERRAQETERIKQIEGAWYASIPRDAAVAFAQDVERARARGPIAPPPNMAPGTAPNPPRPGREPKPPKDAQRTSRR